MSNSAVAVKLMAVNILRVYHGAPLPARDQGRNWYGLMRALLADVAERRGLSLDAVLGAAAAISPGMRWEFVPMHVEALAKGTRGHKVPTYSRLFVSRARTCLRGKAPLDTLGGPKVRAFFRCLMGEVGPVCVDGHAACIARGIRSNIRGDRADIAPSRVAPAQYEKIADAYRLAANAVGIAPHEMQAITWIAWRDSWDRNGALDI